MLAVQAALELERLDKADELLAIVEQLAPGLRPQFLNAHWIASARNSLHEAGTSRTRNGCSGEPCGLFQELAIPFYLAVTRLEHAEWLVGEGRAEDAQPLLLEAREIFERLEAEPWIQRLANIRADTGVEASA